MFKSVKYCYPTKLYGDNAATHLYELSDTNFTTTFRLRRKLRSEVVAKIFEIYSNRKEDFVGNIARYYLQTLKSTTIDIINAFITADAASIQLKYPLLKYDIYTKCIQNRILSLKWAGGLFV